jgi:hypothetical protein
VDSNQSRGSDGRRRSLARGNGIDTAVEMCGKGGRTVRSKWGFRATGRKGVLEKNGDVEIEMAWGRIA